MLCVQKTISPIVNRSGQKLFLLRSLATRANVKLSSDETSTLDPEWLNAKPFSAIPKPSKLSFYLSFLPGGKYHNKSANDFAMVAREDYGDTFLIPGGLGRSDMAMIFNPEDIAKAYRTEGIWPIRASFQTVTYFREVVRKDFFGDTIGLISSNGEKWSNLRKVVNPVIVQPRSVKLYIEPLVETSEKFIERIRNIRDPNTQEVPGDFEEDINRLTFESITSITLNKTFGLINRKQEVPQAIELFKNVRKFFIYVFELEVQPSMWKFIKTPTFNKMMQCQQVIFEITDKFVNEGLAELEAQQRLGEETEREPSVLEKLLKIDKKSAIVMAMDLLLAGVDATSSVLAGILLNLSKNQDKQDILRKEIMQILPEKDSPLTIDSMKNMPYLRACIKESLRYYPIAGGNFRDAGCDIVLGGYQIPKGTTLILNSNLMLRDEKYYSRPDEYLPERWLRKNEEHEVIQDNGHPFSFLPFGFGPRICVGKRIVELELEICLLKIIRNFKVEYNYSTEKPFKQYFINFPVIPLKFKFTDI